MSKSVLKTNIVFSSHTLKIHTFLLIAKGKFFKKLLKINNFYCNSIVTMWQKDLNKLHQKAVQLENSCHLEKH